jgi:hypothetical protein
LAARADTNSRSQTGREIRRGEISRLAVLRILKKLWLTDDEPEVYQAYIISGGISHACSSLRG